MIGEDLLMVAATALYAEARERTDGHPEVWDLVEENFRDANQRVERNLRELLRNQDAAAASVGEKALSGRYPSLACGIIQRSLQDDPRQESALKTDDENGRKVV